jgi:hypothetical protein
MEISVKGLRIRAAWWFMAALLIAVGGVSGCATLTSQGRDATVKSIWQARDQFVAIEKQDRQPGATVPANAHPADIPADRISSALASIDIRLPGKDKTVSLFNDPELRILGENIHKGLAGAGPDEDVTFAVIGHYPILLGVLQERRVTTGRVFCRDGRLQIIFGEVLRDVKDNEDRRLYPFIPGARGKAASLSVTLTEKPGGESFDLQRQDWLTFSLAAPAVPVAAPAVRPEGESAGTGSKAAAPAVSPGKPAASGRKTVEERLMILNDLHDKKLITDEEYRAKRLEILNEL